MRVWLKLLVAAAMLAMVVSEKSNICPYDNPEVTEPVAFRTMRNQLSSCFSNVLDGELNVILNDAKTLEEHRSIFKPFCSRREEVTACMAELRASLSSCKSQTFVIPFLVFLDIGGPVLTSGCEQEGERLAVISHGFFNLKQDKEKLALVKSCFVKNTAFLNVNFAIDIASTLYLYYKEMPSQSRCLENIEDESLKSHLLPIFNTIVDHFKCLDPAADRLIPCRDLDVSKVPVTDVCTLRESPDEFSYDELEDDVVNCFKVVFNHDLGWGQYDDLESLKGEYRRLCAVFKYSPTCQLRAAGLAERCLPAAEQRQFGFFMDYLRVAVERACEHDGVGMALLMHEIYRLSAQHGHAVRECFKQAMDDRKARQPVDDSKNMRWYRDMTTHKKCVVRRLQENPAMAQAMETMSDDVLRQAKCVSPEDDSQVLCETLLNH